MIKARFTGGNIKLGNMATFSKLKGDEDFNTCYGTIKGTCGGFCAGCTGACYVNKSYRYPSVIKGHARNTAAFRIDIDKAFYDLDMQLTRKRRPFEIIRINQSGELESRTEFLKWCELATRHTESIFYIYTKAYKYVDDLIDIMPRNLFLNISIWHEQGIEFYRKHKNAPQVKAFIYLDGYEYPEDIKPQTTCKAYEHGKLNHDITCDKCRKCFNKNTKLIGCNEH